MEEKEGMRTGGNGEEKDQHDSANRVSFFKKKKYLSPFVDAESSLLRPNLITGCECFHKLTPPIFTETLSRQKEFVKPAAPH